MILEDSFTQVVKPIILISLCSLSLLGCVNDDVSDLDQYIQSVKARPKGTIPLLPEIKVVEPYLFDPDGLRNPFQAVKKIEEEVDAGLSSAFGIRPNVTRRKEELEAYSLDTLRM